MPDGKPAGVRCIHLGEDFRCALFGHPSRPVVCESLRPTVVMCGANGDQALAYLAHLERVTAPRFA